MQLTQNFQSTEEQDRDPPDEAERFEYVGGAVMSGRYTEEWDEDPHFEAPDGLEKGDDVAFEPGDLVPRAHVETVWHAHGDLLAAYDEAGRRLDDGNGGARTEQSDSKARTSAGVEARLTNLEKTVADLYEQVAVIVDVKEGT